jgi:hypothetical protein
VSERARAHQGPSLLSGVYTDLALLYDAWLSMGFPSRRNHHPALGGWEPSTTSKRVAFLVWAALGIPAVAAVYPFVLAGFAVRFYARRLFRTALRLGWLGVAVVASLAWTAFTAGVWLLDVPLEGVGAVAAGGGVAVVSAIASTAVARRGGRLSTVLVAYPLGVTALFLPPVVAAFYWPPLAEQVFPNSYALAVWLLEHPLAVGGVAEFLREHFRLVGLAYLGMWSGLATVVGWTLGALVTLADFVRPEPVDREPPNQ